MKKIFLFLIVSCLMISTLSARQKDPVKRFTVVELSLNNLKIAGDKVSLQYVTQKTAGQHSLVIALVQRSASTGVKRGENGRQTLNHVQIVRNFGTVAVDDKNAGICRIDIPKGLNRKDLEVIAFLQNTSSGEINAATRKELDKI